MKSTVIVTLTICCLLYQTTRAATLTNRDGLSRQDILDLLQLYEEPIRPEGGDKRSKGCGSFSGCMQMEVAKNRVAALLRNSNAHLFGLNGPGKRRRSVDDLPQVNSAETE